ncbi:MAG: transposase domain-containing protein [Pseudomonadota bacterium]
MSDLIPHKLWWSAEEIAEAALPDMPSSKRGVLKLAQRQNWRSREGCVRRRKVRGGGFEFHSSLFPPRARDRLAAQAISAAPSEGERKLAEGWAAFEALSAKAKEKARHRAAILEDVAKLESLGQKANYAVERIAAARDVSASSIWGWRRKVARADRADWPIHLAGRHKAAAREIERAEITPEAWDFFKKIYLRPEAPTLSSAYRQTTYVAAAENWTVPSEQTLRRMVTLKLPKDLIVLAREGKAAFRRMTPPLIRDKSHLHATQVYESDYHTWDVFVEWEPGRIIRPLLCAFKDVYSGKTVAWRHSETANSYTVALTLGDAIEDFGIPTSAYFDNGQEFAAKWLTGGAPARYRWRERPDDPIGVYEQLGINVHFTQPYSGQSKTIERTFRDHCADIAKDPRFRGAYVGNKPDAKPENYGERAVPRDLFERVVAEGIAEFNARAGRRSPVAKGRSFDEVFDTSYRAAPIKRATPEQRRLWLLAGQKLKANADSGELSLDGNKYWADWMRDYGGQTLLARFDPEDLFAGLHVYGKDGAYLGFADCREPVGFNCKDAAREQARLRRAHEREKLKLQQIETAMENARVDRLLDRAARKAPGAPDRKVIAPDFSRRTVADAMIPARSAPEQRELTEAERAERDAVIVDLAAAQEAEAEAAPPESPRERYLRYAALIARVNAGDPIGEAETRDLMRYRTTPEFKTQAMLAEDFGDALGGEAAGD